MGGRASVERVWRHPAPPPAPLSTKTHDTMSFQSTCHSRLYCTHCTSYTYVLFPSNTSGRSKRTASRRRPARACCGRSRTPAPTRASAPGGWVGCVHGRTRHTAAWLAGWGLSQSARHSRCRSVRGVPASRVSALRSSLSAARASDWLGAPPAQSTHSAPCQHTSQHRQRKKKPDSLNFERRSAFVDVETNAHFPSKGTRNAALKQQSRHFSLCSGCLYVEVVVDFSYRCCNIRWSSSSCLTCDLRWREQRGGGRGGVARARGRRGTHRTRSTPPAPPPPPSQSPCRSSCP